jgi:hypothetical protein
MKARAIFAGVVVATNTRRVQSSGGLYTHAVVYRLVDGAWAALSWHTSEAMALQARHVWERARGTTLTIIPVEVSDE